MIFQLRNLIKFIQIVFILTTILALGCKTSESLKSKELSYNQRKTFETFYFEASKQKILNNKEKALRLFQSSLEVNPKSGAAMYQVAQLSYELNRYSDALYWAENLLNQTKTINGI